LTMNNMLCSHAGPPNLLLNAFMDHIWLTETAEHSMC